MRYLVLAVALLAAPLLAAMPSFAQAGPYDSWVGKYAFQVAKDPTLKKRFQALTKTDFSSFVDRIDVSAPIVKSGDFIFGHGCLPHNCGDEEAAFTIQAQTGAIAAVTMSRAPGARFTIYGAPSAEQLPPPLQEWIRAREK
jgi:hypothetical protein